MPRPRFEKLELEKRRRLLEAAAAEFAAHGYEGASLNRLIESAGSSKGAFYYYFDDKADLFSTVMAMAWESFLPLQDHDLASLDAESFWPHVEALFVEMAKRARQQSWLPGLAKLLYHPPRAAGVPEMVAYQFERTREWIGTLLRRGQELGLVRPDLPVDLIRTVVSGAAEGGDRWLVERWEEVEPQEMERLVLVLFDMIRGLVEPRA